jgi:hypothetical protein
MPNQLKKQKGGDEKGRQKSYPSHVCILHLKDE